MSPIEMDYNRGSTTRSTSTGISVVEFDDAPGQYYSLAGHPIDEATARSAGFDVDASKKEKRRIDLYEAAKKKADEQVEREMDAIASDAIDDSDIPLATDGTRMERAGRGKFNVIGSDGTMLGEGLSRRDATKLLADSQGR